MNNSDDPVGAMVYRDVRALRRGLEIIEALSPSEWSKPTDLAKMTEIDRPTIYRFVAKLENKRFVARRRNRGPAEATRDR
jgi:DNA-binding IclR family transcriptional regulator